MSVATPRPIPYSPTPSETDAIMDRLWTPEEYDQLVEMGFFEGQRVQLIEGRIVEMPPQKVDHRISIELLGRFLGKAFPADQFCIQTPFRAAGGSDPKRNIGVVPAKVVVRELLP